MVYKHTQRPLEATKLELHLGAGPYIELPIIGELAVAQTPDEAIAVVLDSLNWDVIRGPNIGQSQVTSSLNLVESGDYGTTISWIAEPAGLVDVSTGAVTRPEVS